MERIWKDQKANGQPLNQGIGTLGPMLRLPTSFTMRFVKRGETLWAENRTVVGVNPI